VRQFTEFLVDARYGWVAACEEAFGPGQHPVAVCHEWNTIAHLNDYEGSPEARPFTREEMQRFLDYADEQVERAVRGKRKGALAAYRDATLFKVMYGWGLRRTETSKLDLADWGRNPAAPEFGRYGMLNVRYGKAKKGQPPRRRNVAAVMGWAVDAVADGLDSCHGSSCLSPATYFTASLARSPYRVLFLLSTGIILLAPAVIGLFWGAPLIARELETGTAALAWNQSVTRTRWLAVKLAIGGLTAMVVTEALSLMQTWWAVPISQAVADGSGSGVAQSRFSQLNFATHGITPIGYAAFAFALGVTAGALIRRTVPAMAVTLAIFAALQVAMPLWVRPNLAPPDRTVIPVTSLGGAGPSQTGPGGDTFTLYALNIPGQPGAWLLSSGPVNAAGQPVSTTPAACTSVGNTGQSAGAQGNAFPPGQGPAAFV
jgi:hypothetical protein